MPTRIEFSLKPCYAIHLSAHLTGGEVEKRPSRFSGGGSCAVPSPFNVLRHSPQPKNASPTLAFFDLPSGEMGFAATPGNGLKPKRLTYNRHRVRVAKKSIERARTTRAKKQKFPQKFPQ
jgi:hypothetical protein